MSYYRRRYRDEKTTLGEAITSIVIAAVIIVPLLLWSCERQKTKTQECTARGGHVVTAYGYKSAVHTCLTPDGRVLDQWGY